MANMPPLRWLFLLLVTLSLSLYRTGFGDETACASAFEMFRAHQWGRAADAFQACEKASSGKTDALLYRAKSLVNLGDFAGAHDSLDSYIAAHPTSDDALYLLGYVAFRQDHPKESLQDFARAAKLKPPEASDLKIAALDYVLLNDYNNAARYLDQSLALNPSDLEARYHLGRVRYQQNQFDAAIAAFQQVLQHDPQNVKAEENLGLCFEAKNQNEAAIAAYKKAIEFDSASTVQTEQPYLDLGKLLTTLNRATEAVPVLSRATAIQPKSPIAHYELGRAQFALNQFRDAQSQVEKAAELDPQNSSAHYLLGRIYKRIGKKEEAAAQFKLTEQLIRQHNRENGGMASSR
jgi:tetratricopeptide (TPR) repeat protein